MSYFCRDKPAENIAELLEFLVSDHKPQDLYRGQTKDYPALVPSIYRALLIEGTESDAFPSIRKNAIAEPSAQHNRKRWDFARLLQRCFGLGVGNILSQQYGLSSESIDVSGDPLIAAYFASRSYPEYSPVLDRSKIGVIYRFRGDTSGFTSLKFIPGSPLSSLDLYFEGGIHEGVLFEEFLHSSSIDRSRESNRWTGESKIIEVGTRSLTLTCEQIVDIIRLESERKDRRRRLEGDPFSQDMIEKILASNWSDSRLYRQNGGLMRPTIIFDAEVYADFKVAYKRSDRSEILGLPSIMLNLSEDFDLPVAVPGLAIKKQIKCIENLKHREGVESFFFHHGSGECLTNYRSVLWPEPDEDSVMGALWMRLVAHKLITNEDIDIPIDDPVNGYLDNGYKVDGKFDSANLNRAKHLFRGVQQDADFGIKAQPENTLHVKNRIMALIRLGKSVEALDEILELQLSASEDYFCHYALYQAYWQLGQREEAEENLQACLALSPNDCRSYFLHAIKCARKGNLEEAKKQCALALDNFSTDDISILSSDIINLRELIDEDNVAP